MPFLGSYFAALKIEIFHWNGLKKQFMQKNFRIHLK